MTSDVFLEMALSFVGTEQKLHFERVGFKISGKRMFATYLAQDHTATIFLSSNEQVIFCKMHGEGIYPVPNKWGEKGATTFVLSKVPKEIVQEALLSAYNEVMKGKM